MVTMIMMLNCFAGLITAGMGIALLGGQCTRAERQGLRMRDLPVAAFLGMIVAEGLQWSVGQ